MDNGRFLLVFLRELFSDLPKKETDNRDSFRSQSRSPRRTLGSLATEMVDAIVYLWFVLKKSRQFAIFYDLLGDEASRQVLIKVLALKVLGCRVKLPNYSLYWESVALTKAKLLKTPHTIPIRYHPGVLDEDPWLDYYEMEEIGLPVRLHAHTVSIIDKFALQEYRYDNSGTVISAAPGDIVIDAGGGWGDTSLYFAHKVGKNGNVYCFEFAPSNMAILTENLRLNEALRGRIKTIAQAVWNRSRESLSFRDQGLASHVDEGMNQTGTVQTTTIDDFVKEEGLQRVDFIKMDIEGAELRALRGAEQTIRLFRPKLAIFLCHNWEDFITIPGYLGNLGVGYEFYLGHYTPRWGETVLFARATVP
jgi:FkbM family methyltransferase